MRRRPALPLLVAAAMVLTLPGAAGAAAPSASPEPWGESCRVPGSPAPQATPDCGMPASSPVAAIDVTGETYRIELTAPGALEGARALLAGASTATIPSGLIVRGDAGPNAPWSWHIDPTSLAWAEMAIEICDGRPTQIQDGVLTIDRFCPWSARVIAIEGDQVAPSPLPIGDQDALPITASGGTTTEDRSFARRVVLAGGDHVVRWTTGAQLDLTLSTCPATIQLLDATGARAPGRPGADSSFAPYDDGEIVWPGLPAGAYDLFVSIDCAWTVSLERVGSSAS